jgi:hypothetical protein
MPDDRKHLDGGARVGDAALWRSVEGAGSSPLGGCWQQCDVLEWTRARVGVCMHVSFVGIYQVDEKTRHGNSAWLS